MKKLKLILEKSKTGYGVSSPDMAGCYSYGDTIQEAIANMKDAIETYMEEQTNNGLNSDGSYRFKNIAPIIIS